MIQEASQGQAVLKLVGLSDELVVDVLREEFPKVVLMLSEPQAVAQIVQGSTGVLIESVSGQAIARAGTVSTVIDDKLAFTLDPSFHSDVRKASKLTECQFPAMFRPISSDGHFGSWRGAQIVRHSPNQIHLEVLEGIVVPDSAELMFSPIGADTSAGSRIYGDDGAIMTASDVRSRRIRVRATTSDVLPSPNPGTVTLVMDMSRTLYRAA